MAVNSIYNIYCQVIFASLKSQFANVTKIFQSVTAEDSPPFDSRGKSNLIIDDMAWTKNDAFVVLIYNTGAVAILPRLGGQLIKVFNPTIINVHYKDAANFASYREPRGFNELIPKSEIVNKIKKSTGLASQGYRIAVHPCQEAFVIYTGTIAYLMVVDLSNNSSKFR